MLCQPLRHFSNRQQVRGRKVGFDKPTVRTNYNLWKYKDGGLLQSVKLEEISAGLCVLNSITSEEAHDLHLEKGLVMIV